jgi:outer membrane autotransporter protein
MIPICSSHSRASACLLAFAFIQTAGAEDLASGAYRLHRTVQERLWNLRTSGDPGADEPASVTDAKGHVVASAVQPGTGGRFGIWSALSYDVVENGNYGYATSEEWEGIAALTLGVDYRLRSDLVVGLLVEGAEDDPDADLSFGSSSDETLRAAIYGTWGAPTGLYIDALAGYGERDYEIFDGENFQALLTAGYTFSLGNIEHGPFAGFEYQNGNYDFKYTGLYGFDASYEATLWRASAGYRISADYGLFRPYLSAAYVRGFDSEVMGEDLEDVSALQVTAGMAVRISAAWSVSLGYRGEINFKDEQFADSHGGSLGLSYSF